MDWGKVIKKGVEAGLPAAIGAAGVTAKIDTTDEESLVVSLGALIIGFLYGSIKNWLKHRKK